MRPGIEVISVDIGDGVLTDQIGEVRYTQQACVRLGRVDEHAGDNGGGGNALLL